MAVELLITKKLLKNAIFVLEQYLKKLIKKCQKSINTSQAI